MRFSGKNRMKVILRYPAAGVKTREGQNPMSATVVLVYFGKPGLAALRREY